MKRILITGHTGMVGRHLLERLGNLKSVQVYLHNRNENIKSILDFNPQIIYHLAAEIYDQSTMFDSNIVLTHKLLEASKQLKELEAFIYIGSSSEYGRKDHPMSETDYLDPETMYEATKGAGTLLCQAYFHEWGVPTVIARPFSLYGKYEPEKRFIPTVIRKIKGEKIIKLAPGVHDFIHIDDFIDGLFLLEKYPNGNIYNFGTGIQTSNKEIVTIISNLIGKEPKIEKIKSLHSYDSECWVADISKAHSIGWEPKLTITQGLYLVIQQRGGW